MTKRLAPAALAFALLLFGNAQATAWAADEPSATADGKEARPGRDNGSSPSAEEINPSRFGKVPDAAYGAFQRGYYLTALNLAKPRAENGDGAAQTLIAEIYARGLGVARDEKEAAKWYAKAAEQGIPEAQFQYALLLIDGRYVEKDEEKAYELMKAAADRGNHLAEFNFAQMVMNREFGFESTKKAVAYYERAAEAGLADAQYAMSQVYANGIGGKPADEAEARRWLELAARQNFDTAQLDLGTWLVEGRGGKADPEAGFGWLKQAAEGGNVAAQNRLAKLYRSGVGTEADPVAAAAWYVLARRAGLVDPSMEDFLQGLTEDQRKKAIEEANDLR